MSKRLQSLRNTAISGRSFSRRWALGILACALVPSSCAINDEPADDAASTGTCDIAALTAQCPAGSNPIVGSQADSECRDTDGNLITQDDGSITGVCRGSGTCVVACNFQDPCECGIERINAQGVFCVPCETTAACGNDICEGTESPLSCPIDCASACTPDDERCAGTDREVCGAAGDWSPLACREDQGCVEVPTNRPDLTRTYCDARVSPSGGTYTTDQPAADSAGDPSTLVRRDGSLPAAALGVRADGAWILDTDPLSVLADGDTSPRALPVSRPSVGFAFGGGQMVTAARRPLVQSLDSPVTSTMDGFVDDVTSVTPGAVAVAPTGTRAAVAFQIQGEPLVAVYDLESGEVERLLRFVDADVSSNEPASALAFNHDGSMLLEAREGVTAVWNVEQGQYIHLLVTGIGVPNLATFLPGGDRVLLSGGRAEVWDIEGEAERVWTEACRAPAALSTDGTVIACGGGEVELRRTVDGTRAGGFTAEVGGRSTPVFAIDDSQLAIGALLYGSLNP